MSTPNPFEIGDTIQGFATGEVMFQRYELKKILGRGGMGVVWLAWDQKLEEKVALKFLPETVRMDDKSLADLKREVKRSRELTHKNIVRIHDLEEDGATAAIVMEYVDGPTLSSLSSKHPDGVLEVNELEPLLPQICEALDYAHQEAKIVHRDIKPANIMVTQSGSAKLADFGVARSLSDTKSRMTMVGASAGTLAYMSPQQLMGDRPQSSDDIYALGATIHELLVGAPPFHSGEIVTQIQQKKAPGVNSEREHLGLEPLDEKWEILVSRCLEKDPAERLPSGAQMLALLENPSAMITGQLAASKNPTEQAEVATEGSTSESKAKSPLFLGAVICLVIGAVSIALWKPWKTDEEEKAKVIAAQQAELQAEKKLANQRAKEELKQQRYHDIDGHLVAAMKAIALHDLKLAEKEIKQAQAIPLNEEDNIYFSSRSRTVLKAMQEKQVELAYAQPVRQIDQIFTGSAYEQWNEFSRKMVLKKAQEILTKNGFYAKSIDGKTGLGTHKAIIAYQLQKKLSATGYLDGGSLQALGLDGLKELRWEGSKAGERREFEIVPGVKVAFRWCPAGTFMMGSPKSEKDRHKDETQHKVILSKGFWLAETECTQAQWKAVMGTTIEQQRDKKDKSLPLRGKGANHPMYFVNWDEIQSYLRKLRLPVGLKASLPTEAQWEYACRAGTITPFNRGRNLTTNQANYNGNYPYNGGAKGKYRESTVEVRGFKANAWGLYDMHGNVWEWCSDWYGDYRGGRQTDPTGAKNGQNRVLRGGSWGDDAGGGRSAFRDWFGPGSRGNNLGFRLSLQVASQ